MSRRPAAAWKRLGTEWKLALTLLISLRIGFGLTGIVSMQLQPRDAMLGDWTKLVIQGGKPWSYLLSTWQRWDSLWYQHIASTGYHAGDRSSHFEPLFPLLSRLVSLPLGGQVVVAQLVVSSTMFAIAMVLLYRLTCLDCSPSVARLAVLLMALFPVGFFLIAPYTESLYLALSMAAIWFSRQGRPWMAGLAGLGVGFTRWVGIFVAFALATEYVRRRRDEKRPLDIGFLSAGLPLVGIVAMTIYSRLIVGEHLSLLELNRYWGVLLVPPWRLLSDSRTFIASTGSVTEILNLVTLVGFAYLVLGGIQRLPRAYAAYTVPYLALMFCREDLLGSPLVGILRYSLVLFPCFIVAAIWLRKHPWIAAGWLAFSTALQAILFLYWLHWGYLA